MPEIEKLDLRTRHRYLRRGALAQKDLDAYLASLPDSTENAEWIDYDRLFEEEADEEMSSPPQPVEVPRSTPPRVEAAGAMPSFVRGEPSSTPLRNEAPSPLPRHEERKAASPAVVESPPKPPSVPPEPAAPAPPFASPFSVGSEAATSPKRAAPSEPRPEAPTDDAGDRSTDGESSPAGAPAGSDSEGQS